MRLASIIRKLTSDPLASAALVACILPLSAFVFHGSSPYEGGTFWETLYNLITLLIGFPLLTIIIAWPQIAMYLFVRSASDSIAKAIGTFSSLGIAIRYAIWAANVDLTGSSTASLALIFYPIMVQWWAWVAALGAIFLVIIAKKQRSSK